MTFEIQSSNKADRAEIAELFTAVIEVLDLHTFNATVHDSQVDGLTDYLDESTLIYRMV